MQVGEVIQNRMLVRLIRLGKSIARGGRRERISSARWNCYRRRGAYRSRRSRDICKYELAPACQHNAVFVLRHPVRSNTSDIPVRIDGYRSRDRSIPRGSALRGKVNERRRRAQVRDVVWRKGRSSGMAHPAGSVERRLNLRQARPAIRSDAQRLT